MKKNVHLSMEMITSKLSDLPIIDKIILEPRSQCDLQISLLNGEVIEIDIHFFNEIFPRYIKKLAAEIDTKNNNVFHLIAGPFVSKAGHDLCKENGIGNNGVKNMLIKK